MKRNVFSQKFLFGGALLALLAAGTLGLGVHLNRPRVAIVRSAVVVDGYVGMREARTDYQKRVQEWQTNLDSLTQQLDRAIRTYDGEKNTLSFSVNRVRQTALQHQRAQLAKYQTELEEKAKREEERMVQGTLNQINAYIERVADERGYNVVLGTTQAGNVLYAHQSVDITDDILTGLNQQYRK